MTVLPAICLGMLFSLLVKGLDYRQEKILQSPGLYYESRGEADLYSSEWKIITFVNLTTLDVEFKRVEEYGERTLNFCEKNSKAQWIQYSGCQVFMPSLRPKLAQLQQMKRILVQLSAKPQPSSKRRRGIFNFVGEVSKVLFGTLDERDAAYYTEQISKMEEDQSQFLKITQQHITLMRSTIAAVNGTLEDVAKNEKMLSDGLTKIKEMIDEETGKLIDKTQYIELSIKGHEYVSELSRAIDEIYRKTETLITAVINSQKDILQPQIISPEEIIDLFKSGKITVPHDLSLPFPLSVDYSNVLLKLITFDVFLHNKILGYVIYLPLTTNVKYDVYHLIPLPVSVKGNSSKFIFINPEKDYLLMDKFKRYYVKLSEEQFFVCKVLTETWRICKYSSPVFSTLLHEDCEAKMLLHYENIPTFCDKRITSLSRTLWISVSENQWVYVAPKLERITLICGEKEAIDITVEGTGKLEFLSFCKGYGESTVLIAGITVGTNRSKKDIIPPLQLTYDCCETTQRESLLHSSLNIPLKNLVGHVDELKFASKKVDEMEKSLEEQGWKAQHSKMLHNLSLFSYLFFIIVVIMILYCICCKCRLYKCFKSHRENPCRDLCVVFKPKIVTEIRNSGERLSIRRTPRTEVESTELQEIGQVTPRGTGNRSSLGKR